MMVMKKICTTRESMKAQGLRFPRLTEEDSNIYSNIAQAPFCLPHRPDAAGELVLPGGKTGLCPNLCLAALYPSYHNRTGNKDRRICPDNDTDNQRKSKAVQHFAAKEE
jgi:hypothetical protein